MDGRCPEVAPDASIEHVHCEQAPIGLFIAAILGRVTMRGQPVRFSIRT